MDTLKRCRIVRSIECKSPSSLVNAFAIVTMASGNRGDRVTKADLDAEAKAQALNFQRAVYTQFLERVEKDKVTVKFQDIDDTNALLRRADGFDEQGRINLTKQQISELLGVDAVISGSMMLSKPMGTGTAVVTTLLVDCWWVGASQTKPR